MRIEKVKQGVDVIKWAKNNPNPFSKAVGYKKLSDLYGIMEIEIRPDDTKYKSLWFNLDGINYRVLDYKDEPIGEIIKQIKELK